MNFYPEPIKNWFGFTRRERRSTFTLLVIMLIIIGLRYVIPDKPIEIENITYKVLAFEENTDSSQNVNYSSGSSSDSYPGNPNIRRSLIKRSSFNPVQRQKVIELNSCDSATLVSLPGIGPVLSGRIIKYRNLLGGYAFVDQLKEVYGLSVETFEIIKYRVSTDTSLIKKININSADYKQLSHIRYLQKYEIASILKYRQLKGRITGIQDLIDNKIITEERASRVGPYLKYRE